MPGRLPEQLHIQCLAKTVMTNFTANALLAPALRWATADVSAEGYHAQPLHPNIFDQNKGISMNITLNGKPHAVGAEASVTTLVSQITGQELASNGHGADGQRVGVAVARNSEVVPRSQWHTTALFEGDDIELVTAMQGG